MRLVSAITSSPVLQMTLAVMVCSWLAYFKVEEEFLRTIIDNNGIHSFIAKTKGTRTVPEPIENVSVILGSHMESIEHLDLQPWQKETIQVLQDKVVVQKLSLSTEEVCVPPAPHISTSFCCGGNTKRLKQADASKGHVSNPFACANKTLEDHERVRQIALRYMTPLPSQYNQPYMATRTRNRCDVCRIAQVLWDRNLTLQFIGDSITHQMAYGWICELQSRNFQVTTTMLPNDGTSFDIHISSPKWAGGVVNMTFYNAITFPKDLSFWDALKNVDILVLNQGVHWAINATRKGKSPDFYREQMNQTFQYWLNMTSRLPRLIAFRETSLQHFDTDSGEYYLPPLHTNGNSTKKCTATSRRTHVGWREGIVNTIAKSNGFQVLTADESLAQRRTPSGKRHDLELIWLPFLNFTAELYFMHPSYDSSSDCTHFCQSPYLWWPLWRFLATGC